MRDGTPPPAAGGAERAAFPEAYVKLPAGNATATAAEVLDGDVRDVRAESVTMERSGAESVTAERVAISNSGTRVVEARSAQLDRSGVLSLTGQQVVLQDSSAVSVTADEVRLVRGFALFVRAGTVSLDGESRALVMDGAGARPVLGAAGAAAFGAALALALAVFSRVLGRRGPARRA
ncbi:MAG: hypothetical protein ACKOWF_00825 [Chloroflexota bacterium]